MDSKKVLLLFLVGSIIYWWLFPVSCLGRWEGPSVLLSEKWGNANTEMGFKAEDTADTIPEGFWIVDNRIIVRDQVNSNGI